MIDFIALRWPIDNPAAADRAARLRDAIVSKANWVLLIDEPGWIVAEEQDRGRRMSCVLPAGRGVVIGRLFDRAATEQGYVQPAHMACDPRSSSEDFCRLLTRTVWGAYVAILRDPRGSLQLDIYRDPIGMVDCMTWEVDAVRIVAGDPARWLGIAAPAELAIDWPRVAELIAFPTTVSEGPALRGLVATDAGTLVSITPGELRERRLWTPRDFCPPVRPPAAPDHMRLASLVDACVAAWCSCYDRAVAELSGGLDSAIVAAAIRQSGSTCVREWFHYFIADRQGDERLYARAVAKKLDLPLAEILREQRQLDARDFAPLSTSIRPGLGNVDIFHDRDLAHRASAAGADAIFTGQGGDAIFFQMPTPLLAHDLLGRKESLKGRAQLLFGIAEWTRTPIWRLLWQMIAARGRNAMGDIDTFPPHLRAEFAKPGRHNPWTDDSRAFPPAKRLQLRGLATGRAFFGISLCAQSADVIHPLLSQPLVEHVLSVSALDLTRARRDRALAREAFADRLPDLVINRRGKGGLSSYYGGLVAGSLPFVRAHLLEGTLVAAGIVDRDQLDRLLQREQLIWFDHYAEIMALLLMESWVRHWQARIGARSADNPHTLPLMPIRSAPC